MRDLKNKIKRDKKEDQLKKLKPGLD